MTWRRSCGSSTCGTRRNCERCARSMKSGSVRRRRSW
jgi:hypothetical protein